MQEIKRCTLCEEHLPLGPQPVFSVSENSKIAVIGQAPGTKVHHSGVPWNDASGKLLRQWLQVTEDQFYDPSNFAILPMGFCYPGKGTSGDLPPRPECAPTWHSLVLEKMPSLKLMLLIGQYSQKYYLNNFSKKNLTETVRSFSEYAPKYFPLPHPSPRNRFWLKKNPWFEKGVLPVLNQRIQAILKH